MKGYKVCYHCKDYKHVSKFYSNSNLCKVCWNIIAKIHVELRKLFISDLYVSKSQDICFICNERHQKLDLANINHQYSSNKKDYLLLCSKCHYLLDDLLQNRNNHNT